jgi:hypothetical protein
MISLLALTTISAEELPSTSINYAYATWTGSGVFQVKDRRIYILRVPFGMSLIEQEGKKWGLDLLLPMTVGWDQFTEEDENIASVSFVPGVEGIYPVMDNWWLKPYGQVGVGYDFSYHQETLVWGYGIKSLAQFPYKKMLFELGNSLRYANNEYSGTGGDNGFSMWEIGLNAKLPVSWNIQKRPNDLNLFFVYSGFMNELDLVSALEEDVQISQLYKVGVALNSASNFSILGIKFRGGGLTLTYGDGFTGIGLTTGFPF